MNRTTRRSIVLAAALRLAVSIVPAQETGEADFTKYVALGDSLTAAYWSAGLAETQQEYSYPALLHEQFSGDDGFEQPLISEPGIPAQLQLMGLSPITIDPKPGLGAPLNLTLPRPYDNLGIPGANVEDAVDTLCGYPFFDLILRNAVCSTGTGEGYSAVMQAVSLEPTFVTVWLGSNDAVGAVLSGMVIDDVTLTSLDAFTAAYATLIDSIVTTGAEMALANVPGVLTNAYVTTVPPILVNPATGDPVMIDGQYVPLIGVTTTGPRTLTLADRVLLPAKEALAMGIGIPVEAGGTGQPLPDELVLDADELAIISERIDDFNEVIAANAEVVGAALVDTNAMMALATAEGVTVGGITYDTGFLTGGIFSYDGIHLTSFGYAVIANVFVEAINGTFGTSIGYVDLAPFVFGGAGGPVVLPAGMETGARFSSDARDRLLAAVGLPSVAELAQQRVEPDRGLRRPHRVRTGSSEERGRNGARRPVRR